jgi:hypothetical protein
MSNNQAKPANAPGAGCALVVAHPGHELMVYGWLEQARPLVFVLTDGSGRSNHSRLGSTTKIIHQVGAQAGSIYGRFTDAAAYAAVLNHDYDVFVDLARELSEAFIVERIECVAGDALEGYNSVHDVCRLVVNAAVTLASRRREHQIANFEFSLVNQPESDLRTPAADDLWLQLDEGAFARKISAAEGYAELAGEVFEALARAPVNAFRVERLVPVAEAAANRFDGEAPFYERYGEKQVAAGHYREVLRYAEHIAPLVEALHEFAARPSQGK